MLKVIRWDQGRNHMRHVGAPEAGKTVHTDGHVVEHVAVYEHPGRVLALLQAS